VQTASAMRTFSTSHFRIPAWRPGRDKDECVAGSKAVAGAPRRPRRNEVDLCAAERQRLDPGRLQMRTLAGARKPAAPRRRPSWRFAGRLGDGQASGERGSWQLLFSSLGQADGVEDSVDSKCRCRCFVEGASQSPRKCRTRPSMWDPDTGAFQFPRPAGRSGATRLLSVNVLGPHLQRHSIMGAAFLRIDVAAKGISPR